LHHFAFLVWLPARIFSSPFTHFQPPKHGFLMVILPFFTMFLMALEGYIYTFTVDVYAFLLAFSSILPCI